MFWQFQDKRRRATVWLIGSPWVFVPLLECCSFIPRLSKDLLIVLMDGCSSGTTTESHSITFGMKVIWGILNSRRPFSWAVISEVRLLIQVSVSVFRMLGFLSGSFVRLRSSFGIMKSWLYSRFWAVNYRDVQGERENLLLGCSDTLKMHARIHAQQWVDVNRAMRVRTPIWACDHLLWQHVSV